VPPNAPPGLVRKVFALLGAARVTNRDERLNLMRWILHDPSVMSTNDLSEPEIKMVADLLEKWQRDGELEAQARQHTGPYQD
jgi:hypothetical protein